MGYLREFSFVHRTMKHLKLFLIFCFLGFPVPVMAQSQKFDVDDSSIYSVTWENDFYSQTDRHYTNGVRFAYLPPETKIPALIEESAQKFPLFDPSGRKRLTYALGQNMYTPQDITRINPDPTDRPYAGWLYGTVGMVSDTGRRYDNIELTLGVVGPASGAEHVQRLIHDIGRGIGARDPRGWKYQLKNEPGIILSYERKWRSIYQFSPFGMAVDLTPYAGVNLGNIYTNASAGAIVRLGDDLPADYGPPLIRPSMSGSDYFLPSRDFSWYLFAGFGGRAVARNIFLDGNSFTDSRSVDHEDFVGDIQMGLAVTYHDVRIGYTHVLRSKEFEGQRSGDSFGAVSVTARF